MIRVKEALQAALDGPADHHALALACVRHLAFIVGRFMAQGQLNIRHLEPRIAAARDRQGRQVIDDIARTLAACGAEFGRLQEAAERCGGPDARVTATFATAARRFVAFYDSTLAGRKDPAQQIIRQYFSDEEYWALTDDITDDVIRNEQQLFARVVELAPSAIAGHLTAPWPESPT